MRLYALFKDDNLFRASYKQNVPFYETEIGARRALQSVTSKKNLPHNVSDLSDIEKQAYLDKQKRRFDIREFELLEIRKIK